MGAADKLDDMNAGAGEPIHRVETDPDEGGCQAETKVGVLAKATIAEMLAEADRREAESTIPPASEARPSRSGPKPTIRKRRTVSSAFPKPARLPVVEPAVDELVVDEPLPVIEPTSDEDGIEETLLDETLMRPKVRPATSAPSTPSTPSMPIMTPSPIVTEMKAAAPAIATPAIHEIVIVDPHGSVGVPGDVARAVVASVDDLEFARACRRGTRVKEVLVGAFAGLVAAALLVYALYA
jgi:hypothetical protein